MPAMRPSNGISRVSGHQCRRNAESAARLAGCAGIGLWPEDAAPAALSGAEIVAALGAIGYRTEGPDAAHPANRAALSAFRRHWCPGTLERPFEGRMAGMLKAVAGAIKKT